MQKISDFFANLKRLCRKKGVSMAKMQKDCGLGTSTVYRWKDGSVAPNSGTVDKMAKYFNVSIDEIMIRNSAVVYDSHPVARHKDAPPNNLMYNTNPDLIEIIKSQHETLREQLRIQNETNDKLVEIIKLTAEDKSKSNMEGTRPLRGQPYPTTYGGRIKVKR